MKKIVLFVFNILFMSYLCAAQEDVLTSLKSHLKAGDAKLVATYFNELVEININGEKGSYSKTQAEFVLKDFFRKNPPLDYKKIHQGASKEGLNYTIGNYTCAEGSYRVYIVVKLFKGNYLIDTIDFSKE